MRNRVVWGGLLAGVVLFVWSFVWHAALPTGTAGMQDLPAADTLQPALAGAIPHSGLYAFPTGTWEEKQAKMATQPWGLVLYNVEPMAGMAKPLVMEGFTCLALGLLYAVLLWCALDRLPVFGCRAGFVALLGVGAWLFTSVPYHIWYRFPEAFTAAALGDCVLGSLLAGCVLAAVVKNPA